MNVVLRKPMTVAQFLAWEERQELRHEFDGHQPIMMAGGTEAHAAIQAGLIIALGSRLRGRPCRVFGSELKARAGRDSIRYPDAMIVCAQPNPRATVTSEPRVVFEILSESSVDTDLVIKNAEYRATPSIAQYVVLEQTHIGAIVFSRKGEDWDADPLSGPDAVLAMPEIGISVPLGEIYEGIALDPPEDRQG